MNRLLPGLLLACTLLASCAKHPASQETPSQGQTSDDSKRLRIITWADYVPAEVIEDFRKETGIQVEVTLSNNEEMISKLRATGGAGFDLAQPSQDRISGPQQEFAIYKPIDLTKIDVTQFVPELLETVKHNATLNEKLYALPYVWGSEGLVENSKQAHITDYTDLCKPELKGKTSVRLRRPTLMAFALAMGKDPFALYGDTKAYTALMEEVGRRLTTCKANFRFFYDNKDQLLNGLRSGEITAAMVWDAGAWALNRENPDIHFVNPASGAIAWLDTYTLPAKGKNEAGAYAWINFTMRPAEAAKIGKSIGNFMASKGSDELMDPLMKAQFNASFPHGLNNVKWYPAIPAGLEEIEGRILDRIKAAN